MKKMRILSTPLKVSDLTYDELLEEISRDWRTKSKALQARRWRALKREIKGT